MIAKGQIMRFLIKFKIKYYNNNDIVIILILETKYISKCYLIFFHELTYKFVKISFKTFTGNTQYLFNKNL